jgi:hypothetical protein
LAAPYGASKAFITEFSRGLRVELHTDAHPRVGVTVLRPGYTRTRFAERAGLGEDSLPNALASSADEVALAAIDTGKPTCAPGVTAQAATVLGTLVPGALARRAVAALGPALGVTGRRGDEP